MLFQLSKKNTNFLLQSFEILGLKGITTMDNSKLLRIQSECRKIRTRKNSVFGHFSRSVINKIKFRFEKSKLSDDRIIVVGTNFSRGAFENLTGKAKTQRNRIRLIQFLKSIFYVSKVKK